MTKSTVLPDCFSLSYALQVGELECSVQSERHLKNRRDESLHMGGRHAQPEFVVPIAKERLRRRPMVDAVDQQRSIIAEYISIMSVFRELEAPSSRRNISERCSTTKFILKLSGLLHEYPKGDLYTGDILECIGALAPCQCQHHQKRPDFHALISSLPLIIWTLIVNAQWPRGTPPMGSGKLEESYR